MISDGVTTTIDSLEPGAYSLLVYVSRLSVNQVTPDTNVIEGDTVITDPTDAMGTVRLLLPPDLYR